MAHFAQLNNQLEVIQVIVVSNDVLGDLPFPDSEPVGVTFCQSLYGQDTAWKQTSYNSSFRKNYAGIGYVYRQNLDAFVAPQPFPSWLLNTDSCQWCAPVPYPDDGGVYFWNEPTLSWALIDS